MTTEGVAHIELTFDRLEGAFDMVAIIVGSLPRTWYLHRKVLVEKSGYISEAYKSASSDVNITCFNLPLDSPRTFALLVPYFYGHELDQELTHANSLLLLDLYVVCVRMMIPILQMDILERLSQRCRTHPFSSEVISNALTVLDSGDELYILYVEHAAQGYIMGEYDFEGDWESDGTEVTSSIMFLKSDFEDIIHARVDKAKTLLLGGKKGNMPKQKDLFPYLEMPQFPAS